VALAGICGRMGWLHLPAGLESLTHPAIIALALFVFIIEFVADKVPFVDSAWDSVHTFIRPAGAIAMGILAGSEHGPLVQTAFAVLTGAITLSVHTTKASTRLAINTSPEPFSNIIASVAEQSLVAALFWIFINHPFIAITVMLAMLVGAFFLVRMLWRFVRKLFKRREP
jgi:hypothetical protein